MASKNKLEEEKISFYTEEEIREIIESKEELYYADDGLNEIIVRLKDIPDFIVDVNLKNGVTDLKFFKMDNFIYEPDIKTMGMYLDKISPKLRNKIMDRLVKLQMGEIKVKEYKVIDEEVYADVKIKIEQEKRSSKRKTKKINNKGAR